MIIYNLQFFAKDEQAGEKTEPATAKKLADARKEGQVAKSTEIVTAVSLIGFFVALKVFIGTIGTQFIDFFKVSYNKIGTFALNQAEINIASTGAVMSDAIVTMFIIVLPIFAVGLLIAVVGDLYQVKWKPTGKPLQPKLSKLNPVKGFKKIFSGQSLINLLKSLAIIAIVIYIVWNELSNNSRAIFGLYDLSFHEALVVGGNLVLNLGLKISLVYLVVGLIDLIYQRHKFSKDMKMSKQEVKEEMKNTEGDPLIKNQIRRKMLQVSQRRMMQALPEADVVITNPTHFAVAIKYDLEIAKAPILLAKGEDFLAQKIKEVAKENKIEIVENKPLARMIYYSVDFGEEIPEELYQAVAEVLAFVYSLKN